MNAIASQFPLGLQIEENTQPAEGAGLWDELKSALNVQGYIPARAEGIISKEMMDGTGRHFMLKNGKTHSYARLAPEEFWLWEQMNGEKTIQQLVLAYFMQYKAFAFAAVVSLVERLREANMLTESPRHLYAEAADVIKEQSPWHRLAWLARAVFTKEFVIKNLDKKLEAIHRCGGWILYTVPAQILLLLIAVIGTILFTVLARDPRYNLLRLDAALQLGVLTIFPLVIHEFGHALTAKHFGCEVYKGGAMLYYGMPAAFVDTTDVWMFGKRARLAVTWAGPYTGYLIGGACSIFVYFTPNLAPETASAILRLALASIFINSFNLLPMLKFDGYYLVSDALEIPRLRERSMDFIAFQLRDKILKRGKWTREEKIFLVFGVIAFLSTFYFTYAGVAFWDQQATSSISELLNLQGDFKTLLVNLFIIFIAASSIVYALVLAAGNARPAIQWLQTKGFLSTRLRAAAVIVTASLVLTYLPLVLLPTLAGWFILVIGVAAFAFAAWLAASTFAEMRGSVHAWMWLAALMGLLAGAGSFAGEVNARWAGAGLGSRAAGIVIMLIAFILAGRLLIGLRGSWREISLQILALGVAVWIASFFVSANLQTFAALLMLGGLIHWRMGIAPQAKADEEKIADYIRQRMVLVFRSIKSAILSELELDFGKRTRIWVEGGVYRPRNRDSVGAAEISASTTGMTPDDYGGAAALELDELLAGVERAAGKKYTWRALAHGYDRLHWELQEIAEDHILKYMSRAAGLSGELAATRDDLGILLRSVPLFVSLAEDDLSALEKRFVSHRFKRGEDVVRAGDEGDSFYVIRAGRAEVLSAEGERLNTLGRGDYFGEASLLTGAKRNASIRALTPLEALALSKTQFDRIIRANVRFDEKSRDEFRRLSVLRQIPLFEQFEGLDLKMLANRLEKTNIAQDETVFKQGDAGRLFYIIESGRVSVQIDGQERAVLGAGEYFGEMALMMDAPRVATVVAVQSSVLLQLRADDFKELTRDSVAMKQALDRASSRRRLSNERWANKN